MRVALPIELWNWCLNRMVVNKMQPIITKYAKTIVATNMDTGTKLKLPKYAVWEYDESRQRHNVTETSDNLVYLKSKYKTDNVVVIDNAQMKGGK